MLNLITLNSDSMNNKMKWSLMNDLLMSDYTSTFRIVVRKAKLENYERTSAKKKLTMNKL